MALLSDSTCICCAMPDDNLLDLHSQKNLFNVYKICSGLQLPPDAGTDIQVQVRKICVVCHEQLKSVLKFHEYCQRPNKNLRRCCLCNSLSKLKPLKEITFLHNGQVISCFDVYREYASCDRSDNKMCVACFLLFEDFYVFRDICVRAIQILEARRRYSQLQEAKSIVIEKTVKLEPTQSTEEAPVEVKLEMPQPDVQLIKRLPSNDLYSCAICAATFKSRYNILCHMKKQHLKNRAAKQDFLCNLCGKHFSKQYTFLYHMEVHSNEKSFKCSKCTDVAFKHKKDLTKHMEKHLEGYQCPKKCPQCYKKFRNDETLQVHIKKYHESGRLTCDTCNKRFNTLKALQRHSFDHLGFRPYNCPDFGADGVICEFSTKRKEPFALHLLKKHGIKYKEETHGYKPKDVEMAKDLFEEKRKASKTELTHKCLLCSMAFGTATGLYHHRNSIHLKIKFQCKICDKEYTTKTSLWEHCFEHRGFYPFNCSETECSYKSKTKKAFSSHLKNQHEISYVEQVHGYKKEPFQHVIDLYQKRD